MTKIRILIADDHRVVREGLAAILKSRSDMDVVGEAINGFEVIEKTKALKPDVILMDISMPQMNGVEATRAVRKISPEIGIIVLTMHDDDATIFELVRTGVHGYLLKDADSSEIVKAIQSIYKGESIIHPSIARKILGEFSQLGPEQIKKADRQMYNLSGREVDVLRRVAKGKTNKEIASELQLSEKTIKNHVRNIFHKMGVYDRTEAAMKGVQEGIIDLEQRK
ncbi:response regulator transcription factor [Candidatus Manganitrophus noduliformans]|uniref:Response regulator transcription factor n=1 Tax=Candidatus Manganitrophus noduliformans TaxID=2606439 RepID=A0A7X6DM87_9BACT|nr:response regulator transcription factor [Candidatus Manganitrophus noduliformans]NKE69780.1 response regulator transcription factor [Candidatus Manganitrophus noduliformans]